MEMWVGIAYGLAWLVGRTIIDLFNLWATAILRGLTVAEV